MILDLQYKSIHQIPNNLSNDLQIFNCSNNNITNIEHLPNTLQKFYCSLNNITKIENLPLTLKTFNCICNNISKIENLPHNLQIFSCYCNNITKIENLPNNLQIFDYDKNKIQFIDNINVNYFNVPFELTWYNTIKKFQRRIRAYTQVKHNSAKLIQKGCYNWLFLAKCKDGTVGIVPRLGWKEIEKIQKVKLI